MGEEAEIGLDFLAEWVFLGRFIEIVKELGGCSIELDAVDQQVIDTERDAKLVKLKDTLEFGGYIIVIKLKDCEQLSQDLGVPLVLNFPNYLLVMKQCLNPHFLVVNEDTKALLVLIKIAHCFFILSFIFGCFEFGQENFKYKKNEKLWRVLLCRSTAID